MILAPTALAAIGQRCRTQADTIPPVDMTAKPLTIPRECGGYWKQAGAEIVSYRAQGYFRAGMIPVPEAGRALYLNVAFPTEVSGQWAPHDHARAEGLCVGFFGEDRLRFVHLQPESPDSPRQRNSVSYYLFVHSDWRTPVQAPPPPAFLSWRKSRFMISLGAL